MAVTLKPGARQYSPEWDEVLHSAFVALVRCACGDHTLTLSDAEPDVPCPMCGRIYQGKVSVIWSPREDGESD